MIKHLYYDLVDLVFPDCCPGCQKPLTAGETDLCLACWNNMPVVSDFTELQKRLDGRINLFEVKAYLYFHHKGLVQQILHDIKYRRNPKLGFVLGERFGEYMSENKFFKDIDLVVPVPLHQSKLSFRGFNQSQEIASGISKSIGKELNTSALVRAKKSETQTRKSRAQRWKNVENIFKISDDSLKGKHVLLVDDVLTTGATLESCGQSILNAGGGKISIAVLAMAV